MLKRQFSFFFHDRLLSAKRMEQKRQEDSMIVHLIPVNHFLPFFPMVQQEYDMEHYSAHATD